MGQQQDWFSQFQPARTPSPTPPAPQDWFAQFEPATLAPSKEPRSVGGFAKNIPASLWRNTLGAIPPLLQGAWEVTKGLTLDPTQTKKIGDSVVAIASAIPGFYAERYGSLDALKKTAYDDPFGVLMDLSTVASGVGAGARLASLPRVAQAARTVERVTNPFEAAAAASRRVRPARPVEVTMPDVTAPARTITRESAVPLTRVEQGKGGAVRGFFEGLTERTFPGRRRVQQFREAQQTALITKAQEVAEKMAGGPATAEGRGVVVQAALEEARDAQKAAASALYATIEKIALPGKRVVPVTREVPTSILGPNGKPLTRTVTEQVTVKTPGDAPVTMGPAQRAAQTLLDRIDDQTISGELAKSRGLLEDFVNAPAVKSLRSVLDDHSDLKAIARRFASDEIPGKTEGLATRLSREMFEMEADALKRAGRPDLLANLKEANRLYADLEQTFNESLIKTLAQKSPERIADVVPKLALEDIRVLKRKLPPEGLNALRAGFIEDILSEAISGELTAGQMAQGLSPVKLRAKMVATKLEKLNKDGRYVELFTPAQRQDLTEILTYAERIAGKDVAYAPSIVAGGVNMRMIEAMAWAGTAGVGFAVKPELAAGVGAAAVGLNVFARAMTKPQGLTTMRRLLRAYGQGNKAEGTLWATRFARLMQKEEQEP